MYYNACIQASTTALMGDPGGLTPESFTMLLEELTWGQYHGQPFPVSLQSLLLPANVLTPTPVHASADIPPLVLSLAPSNQIPLGPLTQCRGSVMDREPIANHRPIPHLRLLPGENTRYSLCSNHLSMVNGCTFYKHWRLGMLCWMQCARAASHVLPPNATVCTLAAALTAEQVVEAAAACT